jgi:hypothetical protein
VAGGKSGDGPQQPPPPPYEQHQSEHEEQVIGPAQLRMCSKPRRR